MKPFLRRLLWVLGALTLLLVLFHVVENFRGRRAWKTWKAAQERAGQRYDLAAYIPQEIPDADNFAIAPGVAGAIDGRDPGSQWVIPGVFINPPTAGDWRAGQKTDLAAFAREQKGQSMEAFLQPFEAPLDALAEAARRPGSRFKVDYTRIGEFPLLLNMRARARMLRLRALVRLQAGHSEAALEDVLTGLRMIQHLQHEPHLLSQLLRLAYVSILMQPIWEGLQGRSWDEGQLSRLQSALEPIDLIAPWKVSLQFERCVAAGLLSETAERDPAAIGGDTNSTGLRGRLGRWSRRLLVPKGWVYQNLLSQDRAQEEQLVIVLDPAHQVIHAGRHREAMARYASQRKTPYTWLMLITLPPIASQNVRVARIQSGLDLARIACALERQRLATKAYPADLQALVPTYLAKVPRDVVEGVPLRYVRQGDSYILYSLGWNGTDEGGKAQPGLLEQGDWVWFPGK